MIKKDIARFLCIVGIGVVCILTSALLLGKFGPSTSNLSPNEKYSVFYNRFSHTLTWVDLQSNTKTETTGIYNAKLVWNWIKEWGLDSYLDPDCRYLAVAYKPSVDGLTQSLIIDFESGEIIHLYVPEFIDEADRDKTELIVRDMSNYSLNGYYVRVEVITWKTEIGYEVWLFDIQQQKYIPWD